MMKCFTYIAIRIFSAIYIYIKSSIIISVTNKYVFNDLLHLHTIVPFAGSSEHRIIPNYLEVNAGEPVEIKCRTLYGPARPAWIINEGPFFSQRYYDKSLKLNFKKDSYDIVKIKSSDVWDSGTYTCVGLKTSWGLLHGFIAKATLKVYGQFLI